MDGIHDIGGMHGFGRLRPADDTIGFHEPWEGIVHSAFVGTMGSRVHNIDEFRHAIERIEPSEYLTASYYDRWLMAVSTIAVEKGVLSPKALRERTKAVANGDAAVTERYDTELIDELLEGVTKGYSAWRDDAEQAFKPGDEVQVRNIHPEGHTRCPGYVRNACGTVIEHRGTHTLPDAHAHGREGAEPVYNVMFEMDELWSDRDSDCSHASTSGDQLRLELWESYLKESER